MSWIDLEVATSACAGLPGCLVSAVTTSPAPSLARFQDATMLSPPARQRMQATAEARQRTSKRETCWRDASHSCRGCAAHSTRAHIHGTSVCLMSSPRGDVRSVRTLHNAMGAPRMSHGVVCSEGFPLAFAFARENVSVLEDASAEHSSEVRARNWSAAFHK